MVVSIYIGGGALFIFAFGYVAFLLRTVFALGDFCFRVFLLWPSFALGAFCFGRLLVILLCLFSSTSSKSICLEAAFEPCSAAKAKCGTIFQAPG